MRRRKEIAIRGDGHSVGTGREAEAQSNATGFIVGGMGKATQKGQEEPQRNADDSHVIAS
jgi:hypothetical protein